MSDFLFLFRGRETPTSPEHMQKIMAKWSAWIKELAANGHMPVPGHPLEDGGQVVRGQKKTVSDGPFAEAKDIVCGYIPILAANLASAAELAKGCPILEVGGSVEVRPIQKLSM